MSGRGGKLVWAAVAAAVVVAGVWAHARMSLADRVSDFHAAIGQLGYARGGNLPTDEQVREHVAASAAGAGLELSTVEVDIRREQALDTLGQAMQKQLDRAPGGGETPRLSMEQAHYDIHATVHGEQWLWSTEETVERTVTLRGRTALDGG